jgi:hypothetical protein
MKIIYIFVKLKLKEDKKHDCDFCGSFFNENEASYLLRISDLDVNKTVDITIELTPHTLRRCFTTHNVLNEVPIAYFTKSIRSC